MTDPVTIRTPLQQHLGGGTLTAMTGTPQRIRDVIEVTSLVLV